MNLDQERMKAFTEGLRKQAAGRKKLDMDYSYPDYGRSIVSQRKRHPTYAGVARGATTGTLGAVLGALAGHLATDSGTGTGIGALLGGTAAGIPGYISGKEEAESEHSKNLALRRLGINTPGELYMAQQMPLLAKKLIREDVYV